MLKDTIRCLGDHEVTVIIDATGLSLNQYGQWITVRNGKRKIEKDDEIDTYYIELIRDLI